MATLDKSGKWIGYYTDIYEPDRLNSLNVCSYDDKSGKLEKIEGRLSQSDIEEYLDKETLTGFKDADKSEIKLSYKDNDNLDTITYYRSQWVYGTYGDEGHIHYDEEVTGCLNKKMVEDKNTYFYLGQSNSWLVTYSITKVESTYYDSLSIQYIFDYNNKSKIDMVGPIEYQLSGNLMKTESSYPQDLQGIGYFHTGSSINADIFKISFDKEMALSIEWQDNKESIKLKRQD